ncbi:peptidase M50B-like protein [Trichococcus patagoniensis]|uniref:Peptidase M50B-like protein n=1 Tax=Trichococcus patagoniensis TaxID=382641 RepID=A0A2T5IL64_9LACT|nr:M50 family metallopeptidase [Trichococcus patagoniensis]PTQ84549.1 peptidase M50B-like protein [Trichococcus patagoniensis]
MMDFPVLLVLFFAVAYFTFSSRGMLAYTFGIYLDLPNVIIHECGHALTARLWGGSIQSVKFNVLPSIVKSGGILGVAEIGNRSWFGMIFSLLGGYVSQALFFVAIAYLHLQGQLLWIIPLFLAIYLLTNLLAIEKSFWQNLIILIVIGAAVLLYRNNYSFLLRMYQSVDVITTGFVIWYMLGLAHQFFIVLFLKNDSHWDGTALATKTYIPSVVWKGIFLIAMGGAYFAPSWLQLLLV